jgi:hypothetical protein
MQVFVTKDYLRRGTILEAEGTVQTGRPERIQIRGPAVGTLGTRILHKPDWHATRDAASAYAGDLLISRYSSLKSGIERDQAEMLRIGNAIKQNRARLEAVSSQDAIELVAKILTDLGVAPESVEAAAAATAVAVTDQPTRAQLLRVSDVLRVMCGGDPPMDLLEEWANNGPAQGMLQDWVMERSLLGWAMAIAQIEAAFEIARQPAET